MTQKNENCPKCEHVHKKNLFKINRLKNLNSEQKQTIEDNQQELELLKRELKMLKSRLNKIVNLAYIDTGKQ